MVSQEIPRRLIKFWQEFYPAGALILLDADMEDPQPIAAGTRGVLRLIDDSGQFHVRWPSGSGLAVIPGVDTFRIKGNAVYPDQADFTDLITTIILSSDGSQAGAVLGRSLHPCGKDDGQGAEMQVLWHDRTLSFPCSTDTVVLQKTDAGTVLKLRG